MQEPTYRQALAEAWRFTWHNKIIWILGLLAVLIGQFGLSNFVGKLFLVGEAGYTHHFLPVWVSAARYAMPPLQNAGWVVWLSVILIALGILVVLASVAAQGALVAAAAMFFKKKKVPLTGYLDSAWHTGVKHFWRLLAVVVFEQLALALILSALTYILSIVLEAGGPTQFIGTIAVTAAGFFLAMVASVVAIYTVGYIVVEEEPLGAALKKGWRLFHDHLLVSLETSLLLLLLNLFVVMLLSVVSVVLLAPPALFAVLAGSTNALWLMTVGWALWFIFSVVAAALIGAVYNAFVISAWTYLFMKMHKEGVMSRVMHWVSKVLRRT